MKIKRIFSLILTLIFLLSLCGCAASVYTQADQQYLVSAVGFTAKKGSFKAFVETVVVNTESTEQGVERFVLSGEGSTPRESLLNLAGKISKPLLFDHCGVIAVDTSLDKSKVYEVIEYCEENEEINLAAYMLCCPNIEKLFDCKPVSTLTVGYDILGVIDRVESLCGIAFHNRFYEIKANLLRNGKSFTLPRFSVTDEEYDLSGTDVYNGCERVVNLTTSQTAIYCLITDNFSSGSFEEFKIDSSKTYFECEMISGKLMLSLNIKADIKKGNYNNLRNNIKRMCENYNGFSGADIFGFSHRIYREDSALWNSIKENPEQFLKSAQITVRLEEI